MSSRSTPEDVAKRVQEELRRTSSVGLTGSTAYFARVLADQVRPGGHGDFWYVPVVYQQDPNAVYQLFEVFNRIEEALSAESLNILIVPKLLPPPESLPAA